MQQVLKKEPWQKHPDLIDTLLKNRRQETSIVFDILTQPHWGAHPEWAEKLIKNGWDNAIAQIMTLPHWQNQPALVELIKQRNMASPMDLKKLIEVQQASAAKSVSTNTSASTVANDLKSEADMLNKIYRGPYEPGHYELVKKAIQNGHYNELIARHILSQEPWQQHPDLVLELLKKNDSDIIIINFVLSQPHWQHHPELVRALIEKRSLDDAVIDTMLLHQPQWRKHPVLSRLVGSHEFPNTAGLRRAIQQGDLFKYLPSEVVDCLKSQLEQTLK